MPQVSPMPALFVDLTRCDARIDLGAAEESMPSSFAHHYDAIINWKKRLARELPLLLNVAREAGGRILVPGCGSGGHVLALAQHGFNVLGFDADEGMADTTQRKIDAARS